MTTLIAIRHLEIGSRQFRHGEEVPEGVLSQGEIDRLLDARWLQAYDSVERRSLYRLFPAFSGVKKREAPSQNELALYCVS